MNCKKKTYYVFKRVVFLASLLEGAIEFLILLKGAILKSNLGNPGLNCSTNELRVWCDFLVTYDEVITINQFSKNK